MVAEEDDFRAALAESERAGMTQACCPGAGASVPGGRRSAEPGDGARPRRRRRRS